MRALYFVGSAQNDLRRFPDTARREAGYQLSRVQAGFDPKDWKPIKAVGPGVREIRIHEDGEYRVIYVTNISGGVYALHAFRKKTQATPKAEIQKARQRLRQIRG